MKWVRLKDRILHVSLVATLPTMAIFAAISYSVSYSFMLRDQVDFLIQKSYLSQMYLMSRLEPYGEASLQQRELEASATLLCYTLADACNVRVQILTPEMDLLEDSDQERDVPVTEDLYSAADGTKAYQFFFRGLKPYVSFSSPVFAGSERIGIIRFLCHQDSALYSSEAIVVFFLLWLLSLMSWYTVTRLLAGRVAAPFEQLGDAVREMGTGAPANLDTTALAGEIKELSTAFIKIQNTNQRIMRRLNREKERQSFFFSNATHQMKTPLTSIIGYSQIINVMSSETEIQESAAYIEKAGRTLLRMTENMLDISRYRHSNYEYTPVWFRMDELCIECIRLLQPRLDRNDITVENQCGAISVYFDRQRVREVLLNVLDNCILHSEGDRIVLYSSTIPVRLSVEDNGRGINPEQLDQIFEPFYRVKGSSPGGSGLGLAICREMMLGQGGDVIVESTPGKGARFTLYFQDKDQPHNWIGNMARRI